MQTTIIQKKKYMETPSMNIKMFGFKDIFSFYLFTQVINRVTFQSGCESLNNSTNFYQIKIKKKKKTYDSYFIRNFNNKIQKL